MAANRFRSYFKKKMTFMVVPHDGGRPVQVKTNLFVLHTVVLAFGGVLTWAAMAITKDVNYQLAQLTEQRLRSNMQEILSELQTNRELLSQMSAVDSQFRKLLKLGNRKDVLQYAGMDDGGMGGPTEDDSTHFSEILQEQNTELMDKVNAGLKLTNQQAAQQEASFQEISTFLDKQRSILAATPSIWPIKGWITSGFGARNSPLTGEPGIHYGVDIANEENTPIRATADGIIVYAGWERGYGRLVVIEHGYGYSTRYGHCCRLEVKLGDEVKRGQVIAYVGTTGRSTGCHLHYEVRIHGVPVDPEKYLPADGL